MERTINSALPTLEAPVVIGPYRYELRSRDLLDASGRVIALRRHAGQVLHTLATQAGRLVAKEELLQAAWPGLVVTDDSLVQCIREIRKALGDAGHRWVRTEHRRGYRLMIDRATETVPAWQPMALEDFRQDVRFALTKDGVRLAYAEAGQGLPLVRVAHWLTHVDWDWRNVVFGPRIRALAMTHRLIRYDGRGTGLSDREVSPGGLDDRVEDLRAVMDAAQLPRAALFAPSGGAQVAVRFAARFPDRVSHLVILGGVARGALARGALSMPKAEHDAMLELLRSGWGRENAASRQLMTSLLWPGATAEQMQGFNELQRVACNGETAAQMRQLAASFDVTPELPQVRCPTLVLHGTNDASSPFGEGRLLAAGIRGARLVTFESPNHTPLLGEPAFEQVHGAIADFLSGAASPEPIDDGARELAIPS